MWQWTCIFKYIMDLTELEPIAKVDNQNIWRSAQNSTWSRDKILCKSQPYSGDVHSGPVAWRATKIKINSQILEEANAKIHFGENTLEVLKMFPHLKKIWHSFPQHSSPFYHPPPPLPILVCSTLIWYLKWSDLYLDSSRTLPQYSTV